METIQRSPMVWKLSEQQRKWLENRCCPICGLPKDNWKRRTGWRCCSTKCSKEFSKVVVLIWQYWKEKAFERDKYTCVKCGEKPIREAWDKSIIPNPSELIADHIIPIAIGGEEYDLNNVQTLCIKCNKVKTKEDLKKIALYRKQHKSQTQLNSEGSLNSSQT